MIEIKNLSKSIGNNTVLDNINLVFEPGHIYGLAGENGSGKTMLMRAICGLIYGDTGTVTIDGKRLGKDIDFPDSIGVLIENPSFMPGLTAYKNLEILSFIRGVVGKEQIIYYLNAVSLDPNSKKKYRKFSLGMKQKLGIAAAFFEEREIIVLDEPYNALDEESIVSVNKLITAAKERKAVVIMSCHNSDLLNDVCDTVFHMRNGRIEE